METSLLMISQTSQLTGFYWAVKIQKSIKFGNIEKKEREEWILYNTSWRIYVHLKVPHTNLLKLGKKHNLVKLTPIDVCLVKLITIFISTDMNLFQLVTKDFYMQQFSWQSSQMNVDPQIGFSLGSYYYYQITQDWCFIFFNPSCH